MCVWGGGGGGGPKYLWPFRCYTVCKHNCQPMHHFYDIYENGNTNNLYQYGLLNKNSRSVNSSADALKNRQYHASEPLRQASMSTCLPAIYAESRHVKTQQIKNLTKTLQTTPSAVTSQCISNTTNHSKLSILSPFRISLRVVRMRVSDIGITARL